MSLLYNTYNNRHIRPYIHLPTTKRLIELLFPDYYKISLTYTKLSILTDIDCLLNSSIRTIFNLPADYVISISQLTL